MPPLDSACCPSDPEEAAEFYLLHLLSGEDATAFENHYMTCPACAAVVEDADAYVRAMKAAGRRV